MRQFLLSLFLTLISVSVFSQCAGNISYTLDIPPNGNNTYSPGSVVELCVTLDGWNGNGQGSNWFEGFGLTLGSGWVSSTPTLTPNDAEADNSGDWLWVNTVTSSQTGLTVGPGFFFEGPSGVNDTDPGNDWGDFCGSGNCVWEFCVSLTADVTDGLPLDIQVTPYADGTMGSWGNPACVGQDPPVSIFDGEVGCSIPGCTDINACNYDATADCDNNSCTYSGCNDLLACNFDATAGCDDGSCTYSGCTDPIACNYDATAGCDDGSCNYTPDIVFNPTSYNICLNNSVQLNAEPAGGYWTHEFVAGNVFTGQASGLYQPTYHVSVFDCDVEESVDVNVRGKYDAPNIIYSAEIVDLCVDSRNQSYIADDSVGISYNWFINDVKQPSIDNVLNVEWYDTTQTYTIKVIAYDALGCESEPKLISVRTEACQRFFAPNSFTPNGDGINDIFEVRGLSVYKPIVKIFNRWGVEVYVSSNLYWTGDSGSGYYCDNGVYNWIIEYKDKDGFNKIQKGFVTLIR
jgi:gliding motility-associated-like protein